ncbi:MAG: hypothetical protein E7372_03260 [Clostridiales bacterium]|nr:hypothetical protein [Clostridiales bacterium]
MLKSRVVSGENLSASLLVMLSEDSTAVIKKYGSIAGRIRASHRLIPSRVSKEKPRPNDKISEMAIKDKKIVIENKVFTFLTIIYCIMT